MKQFCPYEKMLECTDKERLDEFYRQMQEAMLANNSMAFVTGVECAAWMSDCIKLRMFRAQQQKQK